MRRFSPLRLLVPLFLILPGCARSRTPPESSLPHGGFVGHSVNVHDLATVSMLQREIIEKNDSIIMHDIQAAVDEWNRGNLDMFVYELYGQTATYVGRGDPEYARGAVRRIHTARWFGGGTPSGRLSVRLEQGVNLAADARLFVCRWTVTDTATGREETWLSSLMIRNLLDTSWTILHEHSSLDG